MKKIRILTLAIVTVFALSSNNVFAASTKSKANTGKSTTSTKSNSQGKAESYDKAKSSNNDIIKGIKDKKSAKQISILSSRLGSIEVSLSNIEKSMNNYFSGTPSSDAFTTTSSSISGDLTEDNESNSNEVSSTSDTTDKDLNQATENNESNSSNDTNTGENIDNNNTENSVDDSNPDEDLDKVQDQLSDEFEKEYDSEDNSRYNSFYGKLNAITNRLNTVERQISKVNGVDSEKTNELNSKITELRSKVQSLLDKLSTEQGQIVNKIKSNSKKKIFQQQSINESKKVWKVHFNSPVNPETVNSKNIMILDKVGNVLDSDVSFDSSTNNAIINTEDGFLKGEEYSIIISENLESLNGEKLDKSVEKKFTVN